jgi:hypothetical protein
MWKTQSECKFEYVFLKFFGVVEFPVFYMAFLPAKLCWFLGTFLLNYKIDKRSQHFIKKLSKNPTNDLSLKLF